MIRWKRFSENIHFLYFTRVLSMRFLSDELEIPVI